MGHPVCNFCVTVFLKQHCLCNLYLFCTCFVRWQYILPGLIFVSRLKLILLLITALRKCQNAFNKHWVRPKILHHVSCWWKKLQKYMNKTLFFQHSCNLFLPSNHAIIICCLGNSHFSDNYSWTTLLKWVDNF